MLKSPRKASFTIGRSSVYERTRTSERGQGESRERMKSQAAGLRTPRMGGGRLPPRALIFSALWHPPSSILPVLRSSFFFFFDDDGDDDDDGGGGSGGSGGAGRASSRRPCLRPTR
ncbi:unnamed protein product, partial [Prorocentrum cordatum]